VNPAATAASSPEDQFQALLHLQASGRWAALAEQGQQLLEQGLAPPQRALVLQLLAEAALAEGDRAGGERLLEQALVLLCLPQMALQWLELVLPEWVWQEANPERQERSPAWVPLCQQLVRQGHGELLLRSLMGLLAQLPLEGQRLELVEAMEQWDALLLASQPGLRRQWQWLQQAAPSGGNGLWA
jgi:hypothetical protein